MVQQILSAANISIHALRVEGDDALPCLLPVARISIHALRVEGDRRIPMPALFCRRISIHALRVEGDPSKSVKSAVYHNFYPRPPGGGRLSRHPLWVAVLDNFYPRPPGGGRLNPSLRAKSERYISIHALRVEGDRCCLLRQPVRTNFYPRPPGGGRPHDV